MPTSDCTFRVLGLVYPESWATKHLETLNNILFYLFCSWETGKIAPTQGDLYTYFSLIITLLMLSLGSPMARGQAVINQELGTYVSEPGESLDAFILRTAPVLDAFTAKKE